MLQLVLASMSRSEDLSPASFYSYNFNSFRLDIFFSANVMRCIGIFVPTVQIASGLCS